MSMRKIKRKYTEGRMELSSIVYALYDAWVAHKYKNNIIGQSIHGFKGLSLFFKESIDVLNSYKFSVECEYVDVYKVSDHVVLNKQSLKNGVFDLWRNINK